jgi:hypothetical protein
MTERNLVSTVEAEDPYVPTLRETSVVLMVAVDLFEEMVASVLAIVQA